MSASSLASIALGLAVLGGIVWAAMRGTRVALDRLAVDAVRWNAELEELARRRGLSFERPPPYEHPTVGEIAMIGRVHGELRGHGVAIVVAPSVGEEPPSTRLEISLGIAPGSTPGWLESMIGRRLPAPARALARELARGGGRVRWRGDQLELEHFRIVTDPEILSERLDRLEAVAEAVRRASRA